MAAIDHPLTTHVNGVDLRYVDAGAGEPAIVFVHGWTCNRTDWQYQIDEFSKRHRVLALDQRGHGESDKPDQDYSIDGFGDDLAAFIAELGLDKPIVVGHSMGGAVAHNLARRMPDIPAAVVMIDSLAAPLPEALLSTGEQWTAGLRTDSYREVSRSFSSTIMFDTASDPELKERLLDQMGEAPQRVVATGLASLIAHGSRFEGPMPVPTLYLRSATTNPWPVDELRTRYPNMQITDIEAAHFLQLERPDEVNSAIHEFVDGLAKEGS